MSRKIAREWAFKILYAIDIGKNTVEEAAEMVFSKSLSKENNDFIYDVVNGTLEHQTEIDTIIKEHSSGWDINRLPSTDRNILRLAIYEILYRKDIPISVSINEAVEMSKKYCDEQSYRFINGLLGNFAKELIQ